MSEALGVDAVGGFRDDLTDACGRSRLSTNVFVWQADDSRCQDDEFYTFAHELAHLAWAGHKYSYCDKDVASLRAPIDVDPDPDEEDWECTNNVGHTLMGETSDSLRVLQFSNPDLDLASGNPLGDEMGLNDHNNAARIADKVESELEGFRSYLSPSGGRYTALEFPERVLNTRTSGGAGGYNGEPLTTDAREISILLPGVPDRVRYVAMNVTLITVSGSGTVRISSSETLVDNNANTGIVRFKAGDTRAQTVVVPLSARRTVWMRTSGGTVEALVDVIGYFGSTGSYMHPLSSSQRVFDQTISANTSSTVSLTSLSDCPSSTTAVAVNLTAVSASTSGYLVARGYYNTLDTSYSTLNFQSGENISNATFVEVDNRRFKIYAKKSVRVLVDVFGCFTTSSTNGGQLTLHATPQNRSSFTLSGSNFSDVAMGSSTDFAALTVADVTSTTTNKSHLRVYKPTVSVPSTSNINLTVGDGISNMMVTPTAYSSSEWRIRVQRKPNTSGTITVTILQLGYFT